MKTLYIFGSVLIILLVSSVLIIFLVSLGNSVSLVKCTVSIDTVYAPHEIPEPKSPHPIERLFPAPTCTPTYYFWETPDLFGDQNAWRELEHSIRKLRPNSPIPIVSAEVIHVIPSAHTILTLQSYSLQAVNIPIKTISHSLQNVPVQIDALPNRLPMKVPLNYHPHISKYLGLPPLIEKPIIGPIQDPFDKNRTSESNSEAFYSWWRWQVIYHIVFRNDRLDRCLI